MKYIFDFDDVLVNTTKANGFRESIYIYLEKSGISRDNAIKYIKKERLNRFSLKKMLNHFEVKENLYDKIMGENKNFVNQELFEIIKKLGKNNCYIVSYGDKEFQRDKINNTGIAHLFSEIIVVEGSKKEEIEKIATLYKNEEVLFIDDKDYNFTDLELKKYPNLKTIL